MERNKLRVIKSIALGYNKTILFWSSVMATKVMISFPDEFLKEVDRIAREEQRSRSELLREAMRLYITMRQGKIKPGDIPSVQRAVQIQNELARLAPGIGEDSVGEIRRWRDSLSH
jgi:hypothetical protein